jgi:F420-0:gamma-glutamyl ligase
VVLVFLIPFGITSCIISCAEKARNIHNESDTPSSPVIHYSDREKKEMVKTYLMLKEAQDRLEKRKKERTIENLVDIMDRGY